VCVCVERLGVGLALGEPTQGRPVCVWARVVLESLSGEARGSVVGNGYTWVPVPSSCTWDVRVSSQCLMV